MSCLCLLGKGPINLDSTLGSIHLFRIHLVVPPVVTSLCASTCSFLNPSTLGMHCRTSCSPCQFINAVPVPNSWLILMESGSFLIASAGRSAQVLVQVCHSSLGRVQRLSILLVPALQAQADVTHPSLTPRVQKGHFGVLASRVWGAMQADAKRRR